MALRDLQELVKRAEQRALKGKLIREVARRTLAFRRDVAKGELLPVDIDAAKVEAVAHAMEALLVMSDALPDEHMLILHVRRDELMHFVHYTRELDKQYRLFAAREKKGDSDHR